MEIQLLRHSATVRYWLAAFEGLIRYSNGVSKTTLPVRPVCTRAARTSTRHELGWTFRENNVVASIMMAKRLDTISQFRVDSKVLTATLEVLREFGRHGFEGLVLWVGEIHADFAHVRRIVVPDQIPMKSEQGVGYFVKAEVLFELNRSLSEEKLQLIAQVHSHPTEAYHSDADDRYAIVTADGGLSLVVPNFGNAPVDPAHWAVYRLSRGIWKELQPSEVRTSILINDC